MRHLVLYNLLRLGLVLETVELVNLSRWARVYSSNNGEGLFGSPPISSLFSTEGAVTMDGNASVVCLGKNATMSAGSSVGESGGELNLAS